MKYRRGGSVVCVLMFLAMVTADTNFLEKNLQFGLKHLIISKESFIKTTLLYGICDFSNSVKLNGTCEVIKETFNIDGTSKKLHSCEVTLKSHVSEDIKMAQVGENKAVLVFTEDRLEPSGQQYVELTNIDLDSCQTNYAKILAPLSKNNWTSSDIHVVPFENTYDIIFAHSSAIDDHYWKGTFDIKGNVVTEIAPWTEVEVTPFQLQFTNAKYQSSDAGYIVAHIGKQKLAVILINKNGKQVLKEWNYQKFPHVFSLFFDNNETVSECRYSTEETNLKCLVLGSQGAGKDEITLDVVPFYFTSDGLGGYVLLYDKCLDLTTWQIQTGVFHCDNTNLLVRRLDAQGKVLKELPVKSTMYDAVDAQRLRAQFFKNEAGETCLSYVNYRNGLGAYLTLEYPNRLKVATQCFADL